VRTDLNFLLSSRGRTNNFRGQAELLLGFYARILQDPLSGSSIPAICRGWKALEALDVRERQISLVLRAQRSCIMLTNYIAWYWLDVSIRDAGIRILDKQADLPVQQRWLVQLVQDVQEAYHLRLSQRHFCSSSYGITVPSDTTTFLFLNENQHVREGNALRSQVLSTVNEILRSWLCYPSPDQSRVQAWLVHVLVNKFGRPILYLESVWKTYTSARRRSIDAQSWYISSFKDVQPLEQAAVNHPLSNPDSSESHALYELATLIDRFMADDFDDSQNLPQMEEEGTATINPLEHQLDCLNGRKVELFAQFVGDCLSIFLKQNQVNVELMKKIDRIPDKLIPFREHAPSRLRIRGDNGPFSMAYARTTEGAYSAVVWRGVTFATPFSVNNRMVFTSYEDFQLARREAGKHDMSYFCDKAAYGTSNPMCTIQLAETYWDQLAGGKWTNFVRDRIVPFIECYDFFKAGRCPPDFPQLGPLASYLLAADYSYCCPKVVEAPNLSEMAFIIRSLNKGAISGLEELGFLTPRVRTSTMADLKESEMAFGRAYDLLKKIIPAEHQGTINLDLIMTEHTLCKFSRAKKQKLI
jgi:hypothetical protein